MEELDLNTNNLCTTEDAFEEFQSGAMYEEDEFITLSDIVSPPHNNPDVNVVFHDDPIDEVSLSIQDEKTVNNINIPPYDQNEVFAVHSQTKDQNNKDKTRTSKRRGRKKKGSYENSDVQQTQCQIDLKPTKPKRQSRKSIIASDTNDLKYVEECVIEEPKCAIPVVGKVNKSANKAKRKSRNSRKEIEEHVKKQGKQAKQSTKRNRKESIPEDINRQISSTIEDSNISTTIITGDNKKNKHKTGRKKQNISCPNPVASDIEVPAKKSEIKSVIPSKKQNNELENSIPIMPLYDETNKEAQVDDKLTLTIKKTVKNSIVSKKVKNCNSDEDIEDLPLSNLSKKTENGLNKNVDTKTLKTKNVQCTTLESRNSTDLNTHSKNNTSNGREKIVRKRGRPKKNSDNSHAKPDLEVKKLTSETTEKLDSINDLSPQEDLNKFDKPEIISKPIITSEPKIFDDDEPQLPDSYEKIDISTESNSQFKRNSKKKIIPDFEYNVDSVVKNDNVRTDDMPKLHEDPENFDTEDSSRRPVRRRVLKNWNYDEGSDEDPYANIESSDDEPRRRKKGGRCYSDDEYFPGDKRQLTESESDIALDEDLGLGNRPQIKKKRRISNLAISNKSSKKKGRKSDAESICTTEKTNTDSGDVDFEDCGDSSIVKGNDGQLTPTKSTNDSQKWGKTNEFENFIAKIVQGTDIKISKKSVDDLKTTLQIPVIEATEAKKNIHKSAQTVTVNTKAACVQTDTAYEIPMKDQVPLTGEQSEKACDFLSSIVQTTAELGQLMTQKSEDFINKKINTKYVTDTFKMDYCVKKSFLLFKLAKHNLVQMEEDLSKQYEEFLRENNLIQHRQEPKIIASTSKASDSDCEIVEEPVKKKTPPKAQKPAFNPKTVFLNKELSIKIAKKTTEEPAPKKKLNIKGRHSVWINDSILVKKVKPNQSFLAQDSRNKKPPDSKITLEEVNQFFKMYERQKALSICAPFIKTEWSGRERIYMCNYFVDSTTDFPEKTIIMQNENVVTEVTFVEHDSNHVIGRAKSEESIELCPEPLSLLCTKIVLNCLHPKQFNNNKISTQNVINQREHVKTHLRSLTNNDVEERHFIISDINKNIICLKPNINASTYVQPLKTLCFKRVIELMNSAHFNDGKPKLTSGHVNNIIKVKKNDEQIKPLLSLLSLCVKAIRETQKENLTPSIKSEPKSLKSISLFKVQTLINGNIITNNASLKRKCYNVETLLQLCIHLTNTTSYRNSITKNTGLEHKKNNAKNILQLQKCIGATNISNGNSITNSTGVERKCCKVNTIFQWCIDGPNVSYGNSFINNTSLEPKWCNVKSLLQLCIDAIKITSYENSIVNNTGLEQKCYNAKTLRHLCVDAGSISSYESSITNNASLKQKCYNVKTLRQLCLEVPKISPHGNSNTNNASLEQKKYNVETLLQLCKNSTNNSIYLNKPNNIAGGKPILEQNNPQVRSVLTLKSICHNKIAELSTKRYKHQCLLQEIKSEKNTLNFSINNVDTVSDDVFLDDASGNDLGENYVESSYNEELHDYSDVDYGTSYNDLGEDDNNWVSQVQMQELRSCLDTTRDINIEDKIMGINENKGQDSIVQIKLEPKDYQSESVDSSNIKTEPVDEHEYMGESSNYSSINIITKQEVDIDESEVRKEAICRQGSNSYDEEFFESFVSTNKMIAALNNNGSKSDGIFSQSSQRVRRQHEPDLEVETDVLSDTMNLLVPQNVETKDRLMESSQEEYDENNKKIDKKKSEKRKCKSKKINKDLPNKGKMLQKNEVTVSTRKIREKIKQAHDKSEPSDSESDCFKLNLKIDKEKSTENKSNDVSHTKRKEEEEKVIQCSDVDSTELITENKFNVTLENNKKYKEHDEDNTESLTDEGSPSSVIDFNEPVEILECEPTLPIFDDLFHQEPEQEQYRKKYTSDTSYVDRHGWKCYPIDKEDDKIYAHAHIELDKLPSPFIETYFQYQDGTDKTMEDLEIDKLTNHQSLQNTTSKEVNDLSESIPRILKEETKVPDTSEVTELNEKQLTKENPDEFSSFEQETKSNVDKNIPTIPVTSPENHVEKKLLLSDSDTDKVDVKTESTEIKIEKLVEQTYKTRFGRTVRHKVEKAELEEDDFMLTADKMMNKELALLHAPVHLRDKEEDGKELIYKSHIKNAQKNASKGHTTRYRIKTDDDSSSEEEKQWFTTKEKLLKRLLKKNEDTNIDDAKRAKIVSEFIEKRGELPEPRQRARARPRCKSNRTVMERRKQIKILSRELFGDDTVYSKKYSPANTSKGRRNIRKVIDKKSLARSTVVANMEEFERKRRLTLRQAQLREDLGCEEGVNVVVINDELCLEYDFEEKRPVVSVHQFFTKVMKAHQYEGVKFMWDACFESLSLASGGDAGGGCILAHCMGLGKTLQVLALLHTVLTHPQVGMRRVLVCCPLSTVLNWVDEIHKWIGPVTNHIKVFELSKLKKTYERAYQLEDWYNGGGIFIIGYELFRSLSTLDPVLDCVRPTIVNKIRTALLDPGPDIIVCDEGHLLKNDCSVLAVAMSRVVTKRRIMLTGTPMQNNLREYYCMVNFVKPNLLGSYSEYSNRFENPIMNGQHRDSREEDIKLMKARTHILHKVLEGCLQRQEASVLYPYLPKKYEYTVFISLTKCQWELYKHYLTHYINAKENKTSVLRDFHVLQKIWTHPLVLNNFMMKTRGDEKESKTKAEKLDDDLEEAPEQAFPSAAAWWAATDHQHMLHQLDSSYKFLVVFQLLHECVELGDKVLIFSTSLYAMDALEFFLNRENKWTLGREYYRLDGSVPAEVRQKWCREFNAPQNTSTKLFLISTRAGSLGLNMTAANRVIILDTSWNPAHDIQSIFRVYRFGQKKDCYIYRLVAMGTMEQKIYERSVTKQAVACRVVDEQQIDRHYNMAELSELYRLDEEGSGVSAGLAAGVRDAALLRVAAGAPGGGGLHAVHEHDSLLRGSSESVLPEHERNAAWMQFQQEHATTHIRNFEINVSKQSVEDVKAGMKTEKVKPEKESETNTDDTTTKGIKKYKRKSKNKNIEPEPQPSTSQPDLNPAVEESMIKAIMNILIKHKFHTTKTPGEISALMMNVRDVVAQAPKRNLNDVDPLTESIARVLLERENIAFPEVKTEHTDNYDDHSLESDDDTDTASSEMGFQERKRRRYRRDSDEEYLPDTRKRKSSAKTRKSNESASSDSHHVALDGTDGTNIISNTEVLDKEPAVNTLEQSETLSIKQSESNDNLRVDEKTSKHSNKKVKISKGDVKKEKQSNEYYEIIENEPLNKNTEIISNQEVLEKEPVVISSKKSETISKKPSNSNDIVRDEITCKQSVKKIKIGKKYVKKEKKGSNIYETAENELLDDGTEIISSKEELNQEPVVISLQKSETFSKIPSESNNIVKIDESTRKQSKKKYRMTKNDVKKNKQRSNIYETVEIEPLNDSTENISSKEELEEELVVISLKKSEIISKKPSETNHIAEIDEETCKRNINKFIIVKNNVKKDKQRSSTYKTVKRGSLNERSEIIFSEDTLETEPMVLSSKKSEIFSKKPSESNNIVEIDEDTCEQPKEQTSNIYDDIKKDSSNECIEVSDNCETDDVAEEAPVQPPESESICLSDDDEPVIAEPPPLNRKEIADVETAKIKETIPLHKSVLTNKNFIKLVAHTYLIGNPMLDEDAAVLAAQYSTLKALKEVQATGKNLTSGPMHDIAMKVLGKDLMKRLFVANPNKSTAERMLLETENLQNKTMNDMLLENSKLQKSVGTEVNKKSEPETKITCKRKLGGPRKETTDEDNQRAAPSTSNCPGTISPETTNAKVVPVGIFKGPVVPTSQQPSIEECILPDDDEVIITVSPLPSPVGVHLARRNSKQLVVNNVSSKESSGGEQGGGYVQELVPIASVSAASRTTAPSTTVSIKPAKATLPSKIENTSHNENITNIQNVSKPDVKVNKNVIKNALPACHVTICLSSDEEDIPSVVSDDNFNNTIKSDSRTLVISTLVKNNGKNSNENNDDNIIVPVESVNTSSSLTPTTAAKTRSFSADERKKVIKEMNATKPSERKCKPGDIIRINESGKVEILKRITGAEIASQSKITKLKDDNRSENNVKKLNPPVVAYPPSKDKLTKSVSETATLLKEDKRTDVPSTSKQQNNQDNLSVLKNVIHIPAFKYDKTTPKPPVESLQTPLPSPKQATVITNFPSPKILEAKPVITLKNPQQVIINNDKQTIVKKKMLPSKPVSTIKASDVQKVRSDAIKEVVIDLTESQHVQINKPSVSAPLNEHIVVSDCFKDTGTNKVSSVVSEHKNHAVLTTGKSVSKVSPKSSTWSSTVQSPSDSKRSSPWSESAQSKKLKTESKTKMALSDFNLDDFDDIIELE